MMKLLNYTRLFFGISVGLFLIGIISLSVFGLNLGIDFKGGTVTELEFANQINVEQVKTIVEEQGVEGSIVQPTDNNGIIIRTAVQDKTAHDNMLAAIKSGIGEFEEKRYESIGPVIGEQLTKQALYQLGLVSLGIILYIAYAFRKVTRPVSSWQFGVTAVIALLHDLVIVLGAFALMGHFMDVEVDSMFVTAMLTVLGFSVHDTIIVFDRIRENLRIYAGQSMEFVINHSVSQTLVRSLNTSLTVLLVLLSLLLFGGETIRFFVLTLFLGVIFGTYSSIFVASPILIYWQNWRRKSRV